MGPTAHSFRYVRLGCTLLAATLVVVWAGCGGNASTATLNGPQSKGPTPTPDAPIPTAAPTESDRILDKTFDDIKFDIEPDAPFERSMLTPQIEALDGKRIRIRGYILPTLRKRGLTEFVLVRDNQECCFGPGAALYDCILVTMQPGRTAEFSIRPVAVEGRFKVEVFQPFDRIMAIYHLEGESVE